MGYLRNFRNHCFALLVIAIYIFHPAPARAEMGQAGGISIDAVTTITLQHWQKYRQFMSDGLIALFEGKQFWRLPGDVRIEVGPTISIPLPKKYRSDTARYSNQVRLVRTPTGGYVPAGYIAGLPCPHPLTGDPALRGQRIFWNSYYQHPGSLWA
jgi:hypothetical protein